MVQLTHYFFSSPRNLTPPAGIQPTNTSLVTFIERPRRRNPTFTPRPVTPAPAIHPGNAATHTKQGTLQYHLHISLSRSSLTLFQPYYP